MWFWWFVLICDCVIPVLMIIVGRMMWKHCPKQINGVVGYRTKMSMINMDTWEFIISGGLRYEQKRQRTYRVF